MRKKVKNDLFDYDMKIYQNKEYFKFSIDSVLLAEFVSIKKGQKRILDMYLDIYNGKFPYIKSKYNNITELCRGEGNE